MTEVKVSDKFPLVAYRTADGQLWYHNAKTEQGWTSQEYNRNKPMWSMKSYLGNSRALSSSAFQKGCRRGLHVVAIQFLLDCYLAGSSAAETNAINRALTVSVEDVGPADPMLVYDVAVATRGMAGQSVENNVLTMAKIAWCLANARKTRVNDWMTHTYDFRNAKAGEHKYSLDYLSKLLDYGLMVDNLPASQRLGIAWYAAESLLRYESKTACKLFYNSAGFRGSRTSDGKFVPSSVTSRYVETLREVGLSTTWVKSSSHKILMLHLLNLQVLGRIPDAKSTSSGSGIDDRVKAGGSGAMSMITGIIENMRTKSNLVGIPDVAVDKHTPYGKMLGRDIKHFITEGSLLVNTDEEWEAVSRYYVKKYW